MGIYGLLFNDSNRTAVYRTAWIITAKVIPIEFIRDSKDEKLFFIKMKRLSLTNDRPFANLSEPVATTLYTKEKTHYIYSYL
jgi:hypothetical protein